jgi:hypothetical protein
MAKGVGKERGKVCETEGMTELDTRRDRKESFKECRGVSFSLRFYYPWYT